MKTQKEKNIHLEGFVLGVLHSAEMLIKEGNELLRAQDLINRLLDGKMRYVMIKRLAKFHKIDLDWKELDITIQRTI